MMTPKVSTLALFTGASEMRPLAGNFQPGPKDVICRRGKTAFAHNRHFRELIQSHLQRYSQASSKMEKSMVVSDVVDAIRLGSPMGGFVRCVDGIWYEVGDDIAREKCGGCFRDMLHDQYKSSTKAKKRRRQDTQEEEFTATPVAVTEVTTGSGVATNNKRRRVEKLESTVTTNLLPLSPNSTVVLCGFGDLLKDIASRKRELAQAPKLEPKKPLLPPPSRFPSPPTKFISLCPSSSSSAESRLSSISLFSHRCCSAESTLSFDLNEMEVMDEFELGLSRFTSVATAAAGSIFSFHSPIF